MLSRKYWNRERHITVAVVFHYGKRKKKKKKKKILSGFSVSDTIDSPEQM